MEDLYRLLRTGHVQAQGIVDTISDPLLVLDSSLCVQAASRSFLDTFQVDRDETIGRPIYELGNGQWDIPELRRLLVDVIPKATAIIDFEVEHEFPRLGRRVMLVTARTLHNPDNGGRSMLLAMVNVTERHRDGVAKDMMFGELRHRMKNLLTVARSIASQTTTEGVTAEEYRDAFMGRFASLIDAQDLAFTEQDPGGVQEVLDRVFAPYSGDSSALVIVPGPAIELAPRIITDLSMVLHELMTNAAKYGALSASGGRLHVSWRVESADNELRLTWAEQGGPPVTAPTHTGFGTVLIQSTMAYGLGGRVELDYAAEGLQVEIVIPLGNAARLER